VLRAKPQRHRDTEFAQRHFLNSPQPRRHEDTKDSRSSPTRPVEDAEAQRRRGNLAGFFCVVRCPAVQRRPGIAGSGIRSENELLNRIPGPATCALEERRPRHLPSLFIGWERHAPSPEYEKEERQNRRASGTSAGEKTGCDERSCSEQTGFSPATGDSRSPVILPPISETTFQAQHPPLCGGGTVGGLRVFVPSCLRRGWVGGSVSSVPLWFFGHRIPRVV